MSDNRPETTAESLRRARTARVAAALSEANARTGLFKASGRHQGADALPDKFVVMRANMTPHSRHTTMEAATEAMGKLNEAGAFLKVETWR